MPIRLVDNQRWNFQNREMARVHCDITIESFPNDAGYEVEGTTATCSRCNYVTRSYGTTEGSKKRCLFLMKQECPKGESNYYESTLVH